MSGFAKRTGVLLLSASLLACAQVLPVAESVAALPKKAVDNTVDFFSFVFSRPELAVEVIEIGRSAHCNSVGREASLAVFNDPAAVMAWQQERGVQLVVGDLPAGNYAIAEMGERNTGGYALAVSRQAAFKDQRLYLKASFLHPTVAGMATQVLTSPCSLVALPLREFVGAVLLDQSNRPRAEWSSVAIPHS